MGEHVCKAWGISSTTRGHTTTKRIPRLECGSSTCALGVVSLIRIELLHLIWLDLFGTLATISGSPCLPSSSTSYCRKHGDCLVPYRFEDDPSLGFWVMTQRGPRKKLDSERIARLMESLSIFFESFGPTMGKCVCQAWAIPLQIYGNCFVPQRYKQDPSLGLRVTTQRSRRDKLDPTHRERLESIVFVWHVSDHHELAVKNKTKKAFNINC
jgi:hypothetical protein